MKDFTYYRIEIEGDSDDPDDPLEKFWVAGVGGQNSSAVPEPPTMLLVGFGLVALAGVGRKKIKKRGSVDR